ncbi:hypothetical protein I4F81_003054 [Pyropia yezoensis]|uniref:Uncharacterized protein n=1 Tax=Pyropia yezoensis TaxID=2788 RepID=A0ACC3BRU4_PYRYE|nr:hypothetical protein I4F81_003054 [Neopyropia yezoensis]
MAALWAAAVVVVVVTLLAAQSARRHHGGDFVAAGLATGNLTLLRAGLATLDWAVRVLRDVTAFEVGGGGDARHSVTFFFEAAARAALLLRDAGVCGGYRRERLEPLLRRLAVWAADVEGDSFKYQAQAGGEVVDGPECVSASSWFDRGALAPGRQRPEGASIMDVAPRPVAVLRRPVIPVSTPLSAILS